MAEYSEIPCPCGRGFRYKSGGRCVYCQRDYQNARNAKNQGDLCACGRGPKQRNNKCKACRKEQRDNWVARHPEKMAAIHKKQSVKKYDLTVAEYDALVAQPCAICGTTEKKRVCDHDHATGKIRGALCHKCNIALHHVENGDWVARAKKYLEEGGGDQHICAVQ